jgi:hypothetical protein
MLNLKLMRNLIFLTVLLPLFGTAQIEMEYKYLEKKEAVNIEYVGGKFNVYNDVFEKGLFLNNNLLYMAKQSIPFDYFRKIDNLSAYTQLADKKVAVDHFEDKDQIKGILFYSDSKVREFTFPAVGKDAVTVLNYRETYSDEMPFSQLFIFGSYFPVDQSSFSVKFPKEVEIGFNVFNDTKGVVKFEKQEDRKSVTYTWSANNLDGYRVDNAKNESALYYLPHVVVYIKEVRDQVTTKPVLRDVADLYAWYAELIKKIDDGDLTFVQKTALEVTAPYKTQREKAAAIYNWVQDNISYVAFGDGFGGFVPRGAASVCEKKYGDCKDMAHVLYVMLNHVGIKAYHTWIGSREKPYTYSSNPTPLVDDHMITAAVIEGDTIFMDGTDSFVRFGSPSGFTQGKEALIGIDDMQFRIVKVPVLDKSKSLTHVNTHMTISGDEVNAREVRKLSGFEKTAFMSDYIYKRGTDSEEEYLNKKYELGNNKTQYVNIKVSGLNNDTDVLELSYDLRMQNYAKAIGNSIYINLNIDKTLSNDKIDESVKFSRKFDHAYTKKFQTIFELPDGYKLDELPETLSHTDDQFGFTISYELKGNQVVQYKEIYVNTLSLQPERFEDWNTFIKNLVKAYKKSIVLQKGV